jgi:hypothetical protein
MLIASSVTIKIEHIVYNALQDSLLQTELVRQPLFLLMAIMKWLMQYLLLNIINGVIIPVYLAVQSKLSLNVIVVILQLIHGIILNVSAHR